MDLPTEGPVRVEQREQSAYWRVVLGGSKGNIIDMAMTDAGPDTDPVAVIQRNVQPDLDKARQLAGLVEQLDADLGQLSEEVILSGPTSL